MLLQLLGFVLSSDSGKGIDKV